MEKQVNRNNSKHYNLITTNTPIEIQAKSLHLIYDLSLGS